MSPIKPIVLYDICSERVWQMINSAYIQHLTNCHQNHSLDENGALCPYMMKLRNFLLGKISSYNCNAVLESSFLHDYCECSPMIHQLATTLLITDHYSGTVISTDIILSVKQKNLLPFVLLPIAGNVQSTKITEVRLGEIQPEDLTSFKKALMNFPFLTILEFHTNQNHYCDDFLEVVGKYSTLLEELYIGRSPVRKESFQRLCFYDYPINSDLNYLCETLRVFSFKTYDYRIIPNLPLAGDNDVLLLLENLKNLESFGDFQHSGLAIIHAVCQNVSFSPKINHLRIGLLNQHNLSFLNNHCQNLASLTYKECTPEALNRLHSLKNLRKYHRFENSHDDCSYFEKHGVNLEQIHIYDNSLVNLNLMDELCRNLNGLFLLTKECVIPNVSILLFSNLTYLRISDRSYLHKDLVKLIGKLPVIKDIWIIRAKYFTDKNITEICKNQFPCLEKFMIDGSRKLTLNSVDTLLSHCPRLVQLGCYYNFKTYESNEITELEFRNYYRSLRQRNLDVKLHYLRPK